MKEFFKQENSYGDSPLVHMILKEKLHALEIEIGSRNWPSKQA